MYPRSFLCEEAKIKQRTSLEKDFCEIGKEGIWESRCTSFFIFVSFKERISCMQKNCIYRIRIAIATNAIPRIASAKIAVPRLQLNISIIKIYFILWSSIAY